MGIKPSEISALIKEQIKNYAHEMEQNDVGTIVSVGDGVCLIYGLDKAMYGELLEFPNNVYGLVMNLEEEHVGAVLLGDSKEVKEGDVVKRTNKIMEVPVGDALIGRVVNALGQPIDGLGAIASTTTRPIERVAGGVMTRKSVSVPLQTGIKVIDSIIPIGRGQRELIIGDRQTGKTAIAIDTIINQKGKDCLCIYVAIGQKNSTVAQIVAKLKATGAMEYTTVVSATASELAPLQYVAPYAGVTIAEEWMYQGKDVLIVYDDLSKHAVAYRTMSLLLRRAPGREAYPGDVFYLHSRLLERSARMNEKHGGGSITALPIIETLAGDISAYIPTNVISITDGQIFLQTDLFNAGQRPAVDAGLSVSRVGSSAQIKAMKQVASSLKIELANYRELQAFSQFGSDLDAATKNVLEQGEKTMEVLKQAQYDTLSVEDEVLELFAVKNRHFKKVPIDKLKSYLKELKEYIHSKYPEIPNEIKEKKVISSELEAKMNSVYQEFSDSFYLSMNA